jgi:nitroreductase
MDVFNAILERRSIRKFKPTAVPKEALDKIAEALLWAPSAGNLQSRRFYFVSNGEKKKQLAEAAHNQKSIEEAPVCIVACADKNILFQYGQRGKEVYCILDVAASVENAMLAAHALGLGTCWIGAFEEDAVSKILSLPRNLRPVSLIPLGYPAEKPKAPARIKKEDAVTIVD